MKLINIAILLAVNAMFASPAAAQSWPGFDRKAGIEKTGANDAAVIVAVEDYAFLPDVPGAARNASDWQQFLRRDLGVKTVLTLSNAQAVREEILNYARRAASAAGPGGRVWFVFIGHGAPTTDGLDGVLIGADGQQNVGSIGARGVKQGELLDALQGQQEHTILLLDACFSGRDRTSGEALATGVMPVLPVHGVVDAGPKVTVMTAARGDEVAGDLPSIRRPAFSYLALGALRGWADDGDGEISAQEVTNYAGRALLDTPGRTQTPQLWGDSRITLTHGTMEAAPGAATIAVQAPAGHVLTEHVDHIPDVPIYLSGQLGVGSRTDFGDVGLFGTFTAGYKLNYGTLNPNEWRVGVRMNNWAAKVPELPDVGSLLTNRESGGRSYVDDNDTIRRARAITLLVGPEVSYAWRRERPRSVDTLTTIGVFGGLGAKFDQCTRWEVDTVQNQVLCEETKTATVAGGGAFAQVQWGPLVAGLQAGYAYDVGLLTVASVGFTVDP